MLSENLTIYASDRMMKKFHQTRLMSEFVCQLLHELLLAKPSAELNEALWVIPVRHWFICFLWECNHKAINSLWIPFSVVNIVSISNVPSICICTCSSWIRGGRDAAFGCSWVDPDTSAALSIPPQMLQAVTNHSNAAALPTCHKTGEDFTGTSAFHLLLDEV